MENKTQIHEFFPEVYPRRVWIVKGGKLEALRERFCKRDNTEICFEGAYEGYVDSVMYKENGLFKLEFDNPAYTPLFLEKLMILGKVVGVIRNEIE